MNWPPPWPGRPQAPVGLGPELDRHLVGATEQPVQLLGDTVTVPIAIHERAAASLRAAEPAARHHRVLLDVEDMDAERNPGRVYGVYVNLPGEPTEAELETHDAGNISLFGVERARNPRDDEHPHGLRTSMDITRLLDRLAADGSWTDGSRLQATFRPVTLEAPPGQEDLARELAVTAHPGQPITIGRISVHYA